MKSAPLDEAPSVRPISRGRRIYILVIFALVSMCAIVDRHILAVLISPIQKELQVNDTLMGLLSGVAFAFFYATAGIPIARYADRGNRRNILAVALALWSLATVACGAAAGYLQLLIARIGVATGEGATNPTMMSLIGSMYRREERGGAIGLVFAGGAVGIFVASAGASMLSNLYGWRGAFMLIGAPGVLLALVIFLTVPEPARRFGSEAASSKRQESLKAILTYLFGIRTVLLLILAKCLANMAFQGFFTWAPTLLLRSHGMSMVQMGVLYGVSSGIGGLVANLAGGIASDRLAKRGVRWYLYCCVGACALAVPSIFAVAAGASSLVIFAGVAGFAFMASITTTTSMASGLAVVRPDVHAFATATLYFCMNLVGAGLGPLVVGIVSDAARPRFGDESLKFGLLIMVAELAVAAFLFLLAGRRIEADFRKVVRS
jgi:predicted MFS family arabinose efflux permease